MNVRHRLLWPVFLLSFVLAVPASAQYGYHFGRNKVQYENFDWHVLKTEHFNVYYYPEMKKLAEHGAHFAEEAYENLQNRFNFALTRRVPLIFYSSNIHFKQTNITPGFIPDGVGGFFEFLKGRVVIPSNGDLHRFRRVVRHEMVHVFTYAKTLRVMRNHGVPTDRFLPLWFTEGLAEYWSGERDDQHEMVLRDALYSNYLVPMDDLYMIAGSFQMYKQGETIFHFISQTYGEEKILRIIENFWKDEDFRDVLELTLNEEFERLDQRWQAWLEEQYQPELEKAQVPSLVSQEIATKGFNSKPAFYRFPDGTRKVYFLANRNGYTNVYEVPVDSAYRPTAEPSVLVKGERRDRFEAFHLFESRISVSKEGKLAFVTKSGGRDVIHVYDLLKDELGSSYSFDGLIAVYSPTWSPGGEKLAFSSIDESGFSDLYVYNTAADQLRRLTDDAYDDRTPDWSPDGEKLAFASDRTALGKQHAYNLFTYALDDGTIDYVTYGQHMDSSPRWGPEGNHLVFTSARPDSSGRYESRNIWVVEAQSSLEATREVASAKPTLKAVASQEDDVRTARRLTNFTTAAFDPVWTQDEHLIFTAFEHGRFTLRGLGNLDSLMAAPRAQHPVKVPASDGEHWAFARIGLDEEVERVPYEGKYDLDVAQGQVGQSPLYGTSGGAVLALSDMLGDDYWYLTLYNTGRSTGNFLENMSFSLTRVQLKQRANLSYGIQRFSGWRYDITDPDAGRTSYPVFRETLYGGFGQVSYPLSKFRRVELNTSLNWTDKDYSFDIARDRRSLLLANSVSLVHDNALYGRNGPVDGWRGRLTAGYTTDIVNSNVNYFSLIADLRNYFRITEGVTFASWGMARVNHGRKSRLFVLGGSWDLRGFDVFDLNEGESVRGKKMWFVSNELRFPIMRAPSLYLPLLRPFGIANLRGALFLDAAHAWNDGYYDKEPQLNTGETLGSLGLGFRMNVLGGIVLRYDIGYRYRDGFRERIDDGLFKQFFFGYDF